MDWLDQYLQELDNPWSVTTWVPDTGGTTPTVTEII